MAIKKRHTKQTISKVPRAKRSAPRAGGSNKKAVKLSAISVPFKKAELYSHLSETVGISKKEIVAVFDEFAQVMRRHLGKTGVQQFTFPNLMKIIVKQKAATKKRKGINPFTGEPIIFKAKPARNIIKVRVLKRLKEMAE